MLTLTLLIAYSHIYPSILNETSAVITNIYGVFIETRSFIFQCILEDEFLQNIHMQTPFSGNRPKNVVFLPRKQLSHCR